jgi:hypothetical protein
MNTGRRFVKSAGKAFLCLAALSPVLTPVIPGLGSLSFARAVDTQNHPRKKKQPTPPPDLPSGPTGRPVPQVPLDSMRPIAPQVSYQNGQLSIVSPNSTLGDILRAVKKLTNAEIDIPDAPERVVMRLGPGTPREVVAELLNGSRFNYVLLGSPEDPTVLTRVVLVAKSGPDKPAAPGSAGQPPKPAVAQNENPPADQEANDADAPEENAAEENAEPAPPPAAEPPAETPDSSQPKTPQQMLQEMQQRQLQMQQQQQQQQNGQPPAPGPGVPPQQPQEPPQPQ